MNVSSVAIRKTGLVTSVGLSAPAACAAIRAKLSNPSETRFIDSGGEWIVAHQVPMAQPWRGLTKLAKMAAIAIDEAMGGIDHDAWQEVPLLLCVAEKGRPGRTQGLDDRLFLDIQSELDVRFHAKSAVVVHGRVSAAVALAQARTLLHRDRFERVLVAAVDSLLSWPTLGHYDRESRLLTPTNSNGFMPGEGAGALLVGKPAGGPELIVTGLGFAVEKAHIHSEEPLRAEGLSAAIKLALADAGVQMHDLDYRIVDVSGEQYYFKEAALALSRTLRRRKEEFDQWHPAECTGEVGAVAGASVLAVADAACRKGYSPGRAILSHLAADSGQRAAMTLHWSAG